MDLHIFLLPFLTPRPLFVHYPSLKKSRKIYASSAILIHWSFALTYYFCEVLALYRSISPFGCTQNSVSAVFRAPRACGSCPGAWPRWGRRYEGHRMCLWLLTWWRACCRVNRLWIDEDAHNVGFLIFHGQNCWLRSLLRVQGKGNKL